MSALKRPEPRPGVLEIRAYVPGRSTTPHATTVFKLSSNETPLGPSLQAVRAYQASAEHLAEYPDGSATALRAAIGRTYGLDPGRIVCVGLAPTNCSISSPTRFSLRAMRRSTPRTVFWSTASPL